MTETTVAFPDDEDGEDLARLEAELAELQASERQRMTGPAVDLFAELYTSVRELQRMMAPQITVQPADVVVTPPAVPAAEVRVDVPDQSAAIQVLASAVQVLIEVLMAKDMSVTVNVPETVQPVPVVNVETPQPVSRTVTFKRGKDGKIMSAKVTEE